MYYYLAKGWMHFVQFQNCLIAAESILALEPNQDTEVSVVLKRKFEA
jgi:hypothetical protein